MKRILLTVGLTCSLLFPFATKAYFAEQFKLPDPFRKQQYFPDPMSSFLPGWPMWIGRLDSISGYYFGKRFNQLSQSQQAMVRQLSKEWPGWIGVPTWLKK